MTEFTVRGRIQSRDGWLSFERSVEADSASLAEEHTLAELGSEHRLKRSQIDIEEVSS